MTLGALGDMAKNLINDHLGTDVFDSTKRKVPEGGIEASFLDLVKEFDIGDLDDVKAGLPDLIKRLGTDVALHYSIVGAAKMAGIIGEGTAGVLGGPVGAAAAVLLEEAASYAAKQFLFPEETVTYNVGEWVQIDNGKETIPIQTKRLAEKVLGTMFQDFPDDEDWDTTVQESYSVGFVVEVGEKGSVTVYNFKFGKEQALDEAFLRPTDKAMTAKFDGNDQLAAVRKLRLQLDRMEGTPLVNSPVITDPGTEVFLDGQKYSIIQCVGTAALVENSVGHQVLVDVKQLEPGTAKHTRRHNYRSNGSVDDNMYQTEGAADLSQGMWVWIRPGPKALDAYSNCQVVLACIMTIEGRIVKVASAYHGAVVAEPVNQVVPVNEEVRETLNSWQHFAEFREAAVTGYALKRKAPGNWYPEITLGIGPMGDLLGPIEFPEETVEVSGRVDAVTPGETFGSGPNQPGAATSGAIVEDFVEEGIPRATAEGLVKGAAPKAAEPVNYAVIVGGAVAAVVLVVYLS